MKLSENIKDTCVCLSIRILFMVIAGFLFIPLNGLSAIIPTPEKFDYKNGNFVFHEKMKFSGLNTSQTINDYFLNSIEKGMGFSLEVTDKYVDSAIFFELTQYVDSLGNEGYVLDIESRRLTIKARTNQGIFYGIQSLFQLLPESFFCEESKIGQKWSVSCLLIIDRPRYSWRSFMLDSGRQFHTPEFVKRYIDLLALFKLNVFHWHLTEDDGWRIEIKKYPKLSNVGGVVLNGAEQTGFYTQDELKEIVAYAKSRYIDVMPEIDLPGHADAALTAYPEYSCLGKVPEKVKGHSPYLFCGGNENTYQFIQDIIDEICEIFPFAYVHLGGDEAPKDIWDKCDACKARVINENLKNSHELQQYFSNRLARYLIKKGKKPVFWEDVLYQGNINLPEQTVIQWWNYRSKGNLGLELAKERKLKVIASPNYYTYLNFPEVPWKGYQQNRTFDLETAYKNNPAHFTSPDSTFIGITACLWTDFNLTQEMVDSRVFPRFMMLAEQMWNRNSLKSYNEFTRIAKQKKSLLNTLGIKCDDSSGIYPTSKTWFFKRN